METDVKKLLDIDLIIASKIMGFDPVLAGMIASRSTTWSPTQNMMSAWQVVETLQEEGWDLDLWSAGPLWAARFTRSPEDAKEVVATEPSGPLAICLAALRAKGIVLE